MMNEDLFFIHHSHSTFLPTARRRLHGISIIKRSDKSFALQQDTPDKPLASTVKASEQCIEREIHEFKQF